jgi:hypothetical protein
LVRSAAPTVEAYLAELSEDRRAVVSAVRDLVLANLPGGYRESMNWGMICYEVPLERYPDTYNGRPLLYIGLAAQKRHFALYLMSAYADSRAEAKLREAFAHAGKKLDLGKCCLRFRKLDDLVVDAVADAVAGTSPEELMARHEGARRRNPS